MGAGLGGMLLPGGAGAGTNGSLGKIAAKAGVIFGASAGDEIFQNPAYGDLYAAEARIITTDVALKFDWVQPSRGKWDFARAERLLRFAGEHAMAMRGHTLIWNENAPGWLKAAPARQRQRIMDEHIEKVASRFAGRLHSWDVVNEPFWPGHGKAGGYRDGPWLDAMGPGYIKRAFIRTAKADPKARLILNEAHCERGDDVGKSIRAAMLRLVDELQHAGAPLHGIGLQGHLQPQKPYDDNEFVDFLWQLNERKLDIYITEFDVNDEAYASNIARRDQQVARRCHDFLQAVLKVPAVKMLISWQLSDRYSWYKDIAAKSWPLARPAPRPLPFDAALRKKPAWSAMAAALEGR